jgi:hypothetical protein
MATVFWATKGILLAEFLKKGVTISSQRHVQTFKKVKTTNSKFSAKQEDDSSPRHPYSPDLRTAVFHSFGSLKDAPQGRRFSEDNELKHSVHEELHRFSKEPYATDM